MRAEIIVKTISEAQKFNVENLATKENLKESMDKMFYKIISCTGGMLVLAVAVITWLDKILT